MAEQSAFARHDIEQKLREFDTHIYPLPGLESGEALKSFASALCNAIDEVLIASEPLGLVTSGEVFDYDSSKFDPLLTAMWHCNLGKIEEACWLLFLCSYFGKHPKKGWNFLRSVYSAFDGKIPWNWSQVSGRSEEFGNWLLFNQPELKKIRGLGNAYKYYTFDRNKAIEMVAQIQSYIVWVKSKVNHVKLFGDIPDYHAIEPSASFQYCYQEMSVQTALKKSVQFDYLALIGNLGIARIQPGHLYLNDILLPKRGTKWLFDIKKSDKIPVSELNMRMSLLVNYLELPFGIQIVQKALGKWAVKKLSSREKIFIRRY